MAKDRFDSPVIWFFANLGIYLVIMAAVIAAQVVLGESLKNVFVGLALGWPVVAILLLVPLAAVLVVMWNVRLRSRWRYRLLTFGLLLLPAACTIPELRAIAYIVAMQALFAVTMLISPKQTAE